jgi:hypothetical protein
MPFVPDERASTPPQHRRHHAPTDEANDWLDEWDFFTEIHKRAVLSGIDVADVTLEQACDWLDSKMNSYQYFKSRNQSYHLDNYRECLESVLFALQTKELRADQWKKLSTAEKADNRIIRSRAVYLSSPGWCRSYSE